jgi:hypothetical protein
MRAIVVFESLWGNTERVARAIAEEISPRMPTEVVSSETAPDDVDGYDLVVVGGPTHAFSMTRPATRKTAVETNGAAAAPERGIREWLGQLAPVSRPIPALVFDTRVESPRLPGSAAKAARHELRSLGFSVSTKAESFRVHGYEGPLVDGELDRARQWARKATDAVVTGA